MDIGRVPQELRHALVEAYLRAHGADRDRAHQALEDVALRGPASPHAEDVRQAIARAATAIAGIASSAVEALNAVACQDELAAVTTHHAQDEPLPSEQCHCFCRITHDPDHPGVCVNRRAVTSVVYHSAHLGAVPVPLCEECARQLRDRVRSDAA